MYEVEVEHIRLTSGALPSDIRARFVEPRAITHLGHIKWEEHCTECAWPSCYTTCDLYNRRNDGNCRRTLDGFAPVMDAPIYGGHVVRVRFKQWGNITAHCQLALRTVADVELIERRLNALSLVAATLPNLGTIIKRPGLPSRALRRMKDHSVGAAPAANENTREPNCFVMEIYNPQSRVVDLSLDIAARGQGIQRMPFKRLVKVEPGFQHIRIGYDEIKPKLAGAHQADLGINPNILSAEEEGLTLFFGLMTFAYDPTFQPTVTASLDAKRDKDKAKPSKEEKKIKVVIWDLDNTLWNGTLIEDGPGNVTLKPGIRETIEALDARGIVNSVASKNHEDAALAELERFGLRDYFVFPMISWNPKSDAVRRIIRSFNVGEDTIAFVDDQPFEREEVRAGNPKVRVYTHEQATALLGLAEFDVPVTDEARSRRGFYQNEEVRQHAMEESNSDYLSFLKQSNIRVRIATASVEQLDRIHELVQRTNQMNFSGNRYSKPDLAATLSNPSRECYLIDAEDNFGKYGYIGFAVVQPSATPRVVDLAFSCRVQSKRVEHAVLVYLMQTYARRGARDFEVFYHATEKNQPISQVFPDLGCVEVSRDGSNFIYRRSVIDALPDTSVITVNFEGDDRSAQRLPTHDNALEGSAQGNSLEGSA